MDGRSRQIRLLAISLLLAALFSGALFFGPIWVPALLSVPLLIAAGNSYHAARDAFTQVPAARVEARQIKTVTFLDTLPSSIASLVIQGITSPETLFPRIKESVVPLTRAVEVNTVYTTRLPPPRDIPITDDTYILYLPLILSAKGHLHDDLSIRGPDGDIATLTFGDSVSLVASCIRALVRAHFPDRMDSYIQIEPSVLAIIADRRRNGSLHDARVSLIVQALDNVLPKSIERGLITNTVKTLANNYVIIARLGPFPSEIRSHGGLSRRVSDRSCRIRRRAGAPS